MQNTMPKKRNRKITTKKTTQPTSRPPVVAVLGHVDHGKTSLLDAIRSSNFQEKEAGGITQSIGAYQVEHNGRAITFIDTPGHAAFTAMRARGGNSADIVVLVVAATEGVKPQTVESVGHVKAAGVPLVVALNKMDLPGANPDKVKQELMQHGVVSEEFGGDAVFVEVSAKTGDGVPQLLEMIQLIAEMAELSFRDEASLKGVVIEARKDQRVGNVATFIVQEGVLSVGDFLATDTAWGKVKRMHDWQGSVVKKAYPGDPVEVLGLQEVPGAGEVFVGAASEKEAKQKMGERERDQAAGKKVAQDGQKVVSIIVKADSQGSLEAFRAALEALNTDEGIVHIISAGLSDVAESDIMLAKISRAIVLGFNVGIEKAALHAAELERVPVMKYDVIYRAIEDVSDFLESEVEKVRATGEAEVLEVFELSDGTLVAGSEVFDGYVSRGARVQVVRGDDEIVHEARIKSLRHGKDIVPRIDEGMQCGIVLSKAFAFEVGDVIVAFLE